VIDVADPLRELVEPAVQGTLNILRASIAAGLRRVVITSSAGAVTDEPRTGRTYDESQWSESTSLTRNPYYYSKRLAEQQAWSFAAADPGLDVVAILPSLVLGPSLCPSLNTSNRILRDLLCGAYPAVLDIGWVLVDVRDVATAHVRAMEAEGAKGRYLCANKTVTAAEIVALLRELGYDRYKLPRFRLDSRIGTSIARFAAHFQPKGTRSYLKTHLGQTPAFDNSKIRRDLDVAFRPVRQTLRDAVESLIEWGHVDKRP
jgi:dihydroflavonol-4-reductase